MGLFYVMEVFMVADERGYLVLSRYPYQRIRITTPDGEIEIVNLPKKCGQDRIGVRAPKGFKIDRLEAREEAAV